jgi:SAM-dependent methyltransferase
VPDQPTAPTAPPTADAGRAPADTRYDEYYFSHYYTPGCGEVRYERNEHWLGIFDGIAERISSILGPRSALDAGCAIGMLVEALRKRGVDAFGMDVSEFAIGEADPSIEEFLWVGTLLDPLPRRYALITCFEVLEHIAATDVERAIEHLCDATDQILFSSTPEHFDEPTHLNVRPPEDWAADFARHGFVRDVSFDATFIAPWAALFRRRPATTTDLVRDYERHVWRLRREVDQLRGLVIHQQNALETRQETGELAARLAAERLQLSQDLLATRDELVGAHAELGEALGEVAVLEARVLQFERAAHELNEFRRAPVWRLYSPYQRLRARLGAKVRALLSRVQ